MCRQSPNSIWYTQYDLQYGKRAFARNSDYTRAFAHNVMNSHVTFLTSFGIKCLQRYFVTENFFDSLKIDLETERKVNLELKWNLEHFESEIFKKL